MTAAKGFPGVTASKTPTLTPVLMARTMYKLHPLHINSSHFPDARGNTVIKLFLGTWATVKLQLSTEQRANTYRNVK